MQTPERLREIAKSGNLRLGESFDLVAAAEEIERLQFVANRAQELLDIFIEGGYAEDDDDGLLINRLCNSLDPDRWYSRG